MVKLLIDRSLISFFLLWCQLRKSIQPLNLEEFSLLNNPKLGYDQFYLVASHGFLGSSTNHKLAQVCELSWNDHTSIRNWLAFSVN